MHIYLSIKFWKYFVLLCLAAILAVSAAEWIKKVFLSSPLKINDAYDHHKVGLIFSSEEASEGYTLITPVNSLQTYLIDNQGKIVHLWNTEQPGLCAYLLPNGNLIRTVISSEHTDIPFHSGGESGRIEEFTWEGEVVWNFDYYSSFFLMHHGIEVLPNGNILLSAWERKTAEEAVQAGRNPEAQNGCDVWADFIVEVKPTGKTGGEIVWEWHVWDHLIQDHNDAKANYGIVSEHPERLNINYFKTQKTTSSQDIAALQSIGYLQGSPEQNTTGPAPDWTHVNAISYNPQLDQIALSAREFNEIWIIDHSTTRSEAAGRSRGRWEKGGDLLCRFGNPMAYDRGNPKDQQLYAQHDVQWIPEGMIGAGNLLLFNNGKGREGEEYSAVEEYSIPRDEKVNYRPVSDNSPIVSKAVWSFTKPEKMDFYSAFLSGAQRLLNGNTLICHGMEGMIFEVTEQGKMVWQYRLPIVSDIDFEMSSAGYRVGIFAVRKYSPDYSGLQNRSLTPIQTVEEWLNHNDPSFSPFYFCIPAGVPKS